MTPAGVLRDRRHLWAFMLGCVAVTAGVLMHLPMFWMGRANGFRLVDMPMDDGMSWGMALIVGGIAVAAYGLLPKRSGRAASGKTLHASAPEDAPLIAAHWRLMAVLTIALVIDVMKPASLGFVLPGMRAEYAISKTTVAWLPFAALCGTVIGSVLWGWLADVYGRRAAILLSAVMFVGTAICGSMPSFWWNVGMCLLMGAAAGGMLPVTYALLAETMPSKQRGWVLVLVGGLGAVGGYLAASGCAAWLEPLFSWRILWFLNLPTGLVLIFLNAFIPESPKYLVAQGREDEAVRTLRAFGCDVSTQQVAAVPRHAAGGAVRLSHELVGRTWALSVAAIAWGLINFGLLLWMPRRATAWRCRVRCCRHRRSSPSPRSSSPPCCTAAGAAKARCSGPSA
jgi:putative MFS transporter